MVFISPPTGKNTNILPRIEPTSHNVSVREPDPVTTRLSNNQNHLVRIPLGILQPEEEINMTYLNVIPVSSLVNGVSWRDFGGNGCRLLNPYLLYASGCSTAGQSLFLQKPVSALSYEEIIWYAFIFIF